MAGPRQRRRGAGHAQGKWGYLFLAWKCSDGKGYPLGMSVAHAAFCCTGIFWNREAERGEQRLCWKRTGKDWLERPGEVGRAGVSRPFERGPAMTLLRLQP